jgi:hypothetical protein
MLVCIQVKLKDLIKKSKIMDEIKKWKHLLSHKIEDKRLLNGIIHSNKEYK